MIELIDRQVAIERIASIRPSTPKQSDYSHGVDVGMAMSIVAIKEQPSAQPDVPDTNVGDTISRQAAVEAINKALDRETLLNSFVRKIAVDAVKVLPSAERTGRWLDTYNDGDWHCSECGAIVEKDEQIRHYWQRCYHCGAKMQQGEEL